MIDKVKSYIERDVRYKDLIRAVYNNPYSERKVVLRDANMELEEAEEFLNELEQDLVILELTSQANSNIESRVPKKIYLINPDIEQDLESVL